MTQQSILKNSDVRWDERTGRPKKIRGEFVLPAADSTEDAVKIFLQTHREELRFDVAAKDLKKIQDTDTPIRRTIRFQQLLGGLPVFGGMIAIHLDKGNRIRQIDLAHAPAGRCCAAGSDAKITAKEALKRASEAIGPFTQRSKPPKPEKIYYPTEAGLRLAYLILIPTRNPAHDWRIIVDAYTGDILSREDLIFHLPDGEGYVFDPNPVVTANDNTLRDPDATVATCYFAGSPRARIDAQRVTKTLRELKRSGGKYKLDGPFVRLKNFGPPDIAPPEESNADDFKYSSGDDRFEAVMIYYHVDTIQRYLQSLGITTAHNRQIEADAHDSSGGAWFSPMDGGIHFGSSGPCRPDRGEEADAIIHEYGHAIQHDQVPGWGAANPVTGRDETRAMGEGFGDILACVYFAEKGGGYQREVFEDWVFGDIDGLRRVDGIKTYPSDWTNDEHENGEIWSAALWNIYRATGGDAINPVQRQQAADALLKTVILSHHLLSADASLPDGAEAIMETNAEDEEYRGRHLMEMLDSFHDRGILVCDANADLYIRDGADDPGTDHYVGAAFWNSPDLWIRNSDDGGTTHQNPEFGQDNWFHARIHNRGTATARAFVVTFNVKTWAGTQFVYPHDFVPYISAAVGFNLAPGASTVVKAKWPAALVPPAGTHACWLASVYTPTDVAPVGRRAWEHNNLAQKNLTVVDLAPNDSVVIPFQLGNRFQFNSALYRIEVRRPQNWSRVPVAIIHRDPQVVRKLFHSIEEVEVKPEHPTQNLTPFIRFLEPTRVEINHHGLKTEPIRLNMNRDSTMDIGSGAVEDEAEMLHLDAADASAELVTDSQGNTAIRLRPGSLSGFPVALRPRTQIKAGLRITAPPEAKPGEVIELHLVQRNRKGQVVGGITVQINII